MKRCFLSIGLLLILVTGCTAEDPGHVLVDNDGSFPIIGSTNSTLVDTDGDALTVDEKTGILVGIRYVHYKIHKGDSYVVYVADHDLDDGETLDLTVITANTTDWIHAAWSAEGTAAIHIFLYEGVTSNVTGTPLFPINRDRNSANTSNSTFRDGDTFSNTGTLIWEWHTGDRKMAGAGGQREEYILRQGTQYLFRIESEADNNKVSGEVGFYEHANEG